jgi:uncharacterized protein DUF4190
MSDTSQGPGWWLASDGRWYPPEQWTGPPESAPPTIAPPTIAPPTMPAQTTVPFPPTTPTYPQSQPQPGQAPLYPPTGGPGSVPPVPSGYGYPGYGYVAPVSTPSGSTNGLAIAAFVCSLVGLFFVTFIVGIVLGFVARSQIKKSAGQQRGDGLALAAIIIGFAWAAFFILTIALGAAHHDNNNGDVISWTVLMTSWI